MINGGGAGRRARPRTKPAPINAMVVSSTGAKRSFLSRRAQALQNLRLVQKCHLRRSSFVPHSEQKFGLYIVRCPSGSVLISVSLWNLRAPQRTHRDNSKFAKAREETLISHFRKQLKCCLMRPKVTIVELVVRLIVDLRANPRCRPIAKNLACRDTQGNQNRER